LGEQLGDYRCVGIGQVAESLGHVGNAFQPGTRSWGFLHLVADQGFTNDGRC